MTDQTTEPKEMSNEEYLKSIAGELMADPDWQFPPDMRFFLVSDLEWMLLAK